MDSKSRHSSTRRQVLKDATVAGASVLLSCNADAPPSGAPSPPSPQRMGDAGTDAAQAAADASSVDASAGDAGSTVVLAPFDSSNASQRWQIAAAGGGAFTLVNANGQALTAPGTGTALTLAAYSGAAGKTGRFRRPTPGTTSSRAARTAARSLATTRERRRAPSCICGTTSAGTPIKTGLWWTRRCSRRSRGSTTLGSTAAQP
jgi:hypothetical protein